MSIQTPATTWKTREEQPVRVLIVDDSVVARTVLDRIVSAHPGFTVARKTSNAEEALALLKVERVDIVLLDVEMPGQSGLAALPAILRAGRGAKVVILSGNCEEGSADAIEALAIGASDIVSKPGSGSFGDQFSRSLLERIGRIVGRHGALEGLAQTVRLRTPDGAQPLRCLGIGASTGGIHALGQLFAGMTTPLGVPILLTQHLPPSFIPYFASQLTRMTPLPVKVAEQGEILKANHIYIAPGDANLGCRRLRAGQVSVSLMTERAPLDSLPAVDPMFSSIAQCYGASAGGVVLTGMGRDGTAGARRIVAESGWVVAQDEASSVVWGMPGSVARAGLASALLAPGQIMAHAAARASVTA